MKKYVIQFVDSSLVDSFYRIEAINIVDALAQFIKRYPFEVLLIIRLNEPEIL